MTKQSENIKGLIKDQVDMGTYGLVELELKKLENLHKINSWIPYDYSNQKTHPTKYGKYFVHRKDGKTHWETWNGTGWAYNNNMITFYMEIVAPNK